MSNSFNAEAAGMAAGLSSSIDDPIVPAEFAAHADAYLSAFYSVRVSMGTGCRFSKDTAPTAPQKPRKRKAAAVVDAEPEAKVELQAKKSMNQILAEQEHLLQTA